MKILLVEDDHLQASGIKHTIEQEFPDAQVDVVSTESQFVSEFDQIAAFGYDVAIFDVMMRWADPAPNMAPPPLEVREEGFFRAGLRCRRQLLADPRSKAVPAVLFTVLDSGHLPPDVTVVQKSEDGSALIAEIRRLTRHAED